MILVYNYGQSQENTVSATDVDVLFEKARNYRNQNKIDLALEYLNAAMDIAAREKNNKTLIDCYHQFSIIYLKLDRDDTAEFYWDRSKSLLKDISYPYGNAVHKYIEAIIAFRGGKNFLAISMLNEAKQINNDRNLLNNILFIEGNIFLKLEKFSSAQKNFNSLIVNTDIYEQAYLTTNSYLKLAELHLISTTLEASILDAESALKLAKSNGFYAEELRAYEILTNASTQLGQYESALTYNKNTVKIKDSVFNVEKIIAESKTADKIQTNFMKDEIARQEEIITELSQSKSRSEITAILTSAFLTVISILAISLYRNNQIKLRTNDLLQTKNSELQVARDAAVKAMEAKTNFLSTVSHELRTPLYAVTGLTHLLLEENPSANQKEHLKSLKFSGDYLLNFINDILQINKIDAEKLEALKIDFNLKKILSEVIFSLQQGAKTNKTKIVLQYDDSIPSHLLGDPLKLSQIFINLIGNSIKFTKNGEVTVITKLIEKVNENVNIYCEVKDTGIGIEKERQQTIFDSFEQGSIQINREYGGSGLGLTIVKSLLSLFGSKIGLKSELGMGSSFFFNLELKSKSDLVEYITYETPAQTYDFTGLHLLVVEDNKINQVITKKMLDKKKITCDIANNGLEAVAMVRKTHYDGILMDIHMPGISGEEATIEIRKFNRLVPIIALTAISLDDSLESFYAAGCNDVVTKPFKPEVFYRKIGENIFDIKKPKTTA
ncbi:hybrid sensor histidine kinase/response regulator [Arenibacter sp. H213]|uniref:histidine kinase n=1 Tax=Arenibacter antarcticus TaxID=2040469 RepID=A0ABW5VJZ7_9FLAO|nr:ATP-binding protein [Arenibacter sp. H213]MCM4169641.1 hybrid sensor histidine kinase/response regulator [Arenibacter sp. H213]